MNAVCELINVCKSFGDTRLFINYNLSVSAGEMIAVTGKSGSGKTTLLNIIGLLDNPDEGSVVLFGEKYLKPHRNTVIKLLRNKLGYLFQNFALMESESVDMNLNLPLTYVKKSRNEKLKLKLDALEQVGLGDILRRKIYECSGGEQQRIAIARLLLKPCELILADEPTGSLDAENRESVLNILKNLNKGGKTIVIVTHDDYVAQACSRVIKLTYP